MFEQRPKLYLAVKNLAKCAGAGGLIFAIAFGFGVFDPDLEVQSSDADILALDFAKRTPVEKFEGALDDLGHRDPRPFNMNGNVVFFSSLETEEEPLAVMERYQRQFYESGLNSEPFYEVNDKNSEKIILEGHQGGIVPMHIDPNHIILGGMEMAEKVVDHDDLEQAFKKHNLEEPWKLYKGYRNIEITKTERNTLVTASWSHNDFDYEKMMLGNEAEDQNASADIPGCIGCVRVNSFEDLDGDSAYRNDVYLGRSSPRDMSLFYDRALARRGWEPTEATGAFDKVRQYADFQGQDSIMRRYARGNEFITVIAYPDKRDDISVVHAVKHE